MCYLASVTAYRVKVQCEIPSCTINVVFCFVIQHCLLRLQMALILSPDRCTWLLISLNTSTCKLRTKMHIVIYVVVCKAAEKRKIKGNMYDIPSFYLLVKFQSSGGVVFKPLACGARGTGFDSRSPLQFQRLVISCFQVTICLKYCSSGVNPQNYQPSFVKFYAPGMEFGASSIW